MTKWLARHKLVGIVGLVTCLGLFIWLRWFSTLWHYRWTGFLLGLLFVLSSLWRPSTIQPWRDRIRHFASRNVGGFLVIIGPLIGGAILAKDFLTGPPFFFPTGPRAGSDEGLVGVVLLASTIEAAYSLWLSKRSASSGRDSLVKT